MIRRVNLYIGSAKDIIANVYGVAVENHPAIVHVKAIADRNMAAVIAVKRWHDLGLLTNASKQSAQSLDTLITFRFGRLVVEPQESQSSLSPRYQLGISGKIKFACQHLLLFGFRCVAHSTLAGMAIVQPFRGLAIAGLLRHFLNQHIRLHNERIEARGLVYIPV